MSAAEDIPKESKLNPAIKRSVDDETDSSFENSNGTKKKFALKTSNDGTKKILLQKKMSIQLKSAVKPAAAQQATAVTIKPKVGKAAIAFKDEESDEEEEIPPEAKMRMRNIGRETPTSSGPNSYGKSKLGFVDSKKLYERKLREMEEELCDDKSLSKT